MKKKIFNKISIILLCLLCLNTVIPMAAERVELKNSTPHDIYTACLEEGMNVDAKSAILIEPVTGTVLYEKNPDEKFAPASVTIKNSPTIAIMTCGLMILYSLPLVA